MKTVSDIIALFGGGAEVGRILNVPRHTVYTWMNRNRLPGDKDVALVEEAQRRGIDLSFEDIARVRAGQAAA